MPTQQELADHLDLSQKSISEIATKLGVDYKNCSIDQFRIAYIRHIRAVASGHQSVEGLDLTYERILTERVDRELKELMVAEKRGVLINVTQLEPELANMIGAFKTELLARDDKLVNDIYALYGIRVDVGIINKYTFSTLEQFSRYQPGDYGADPEDARPAEAAGGDDHH